MKKEKKNLNVFGRPLLEDRPPFRVQDNGASLPLKFKILQLEMFNGTKDSLDHLETYKALMPLQAILNEIMCRAFPITLKGLA